MDGITEMAKLLKERDNVLYQGPVTGIVIKPLPEIKIALGDRIILEKKHLIFAAHVLNGYKRRFMVEETDSTGTTSTNNAHSHGVDTIGILNGEIEWLDTIKKDDEVILIPSRDGQRFYVIDKAVRL